MLVSGAATDADLLAINEDDTENVKRGGQCSRCAAVRKRSTCRGTLGTLKSAAERFFQRHASLFMASKLKIIKASKLLHRRHVDIFT